MRTIWYFTTAQSQENFEKELSNFNVVPNLSNQNFHNKLIRCLALSNNVQVISSRPINNSYKFSTIPAEKVCDKNITWNYLKVSKSKVSKFLSFKQQISRIISGAKKDDVIFVDTLNFSLLKYAKKIAKKFECKIVGICTDNPNNISFINSSYKTHLLKLGRDLDFYICLTSKLNELYNLNNKKFLVIEGISEEVNYETRQIADDYIYFGGSLLEDYGIKELIKAFEQLKINDLKLVIAGHHATQDFLDYIKNKNQVVYLGPVTYLKNLTLQHYSLCNVNPRPLSSLDEYSFPSKVIEYLLSGSVTVSTLNPILYKVFPESFIWAKSSDSNDLCLAIKKALSLSQVERNHLIQEAKKEVLCRTSLQTINKKIEELLS